MGAFLRGDNMNRLRKSSNTDAGEIDSQRNFGQPTHDPLPKSKRRTKHAAIFEAMVLPVILTVWMAFWVFVVGWIVWLWAK
jgi:hypothetical protein